MVKAAQKAAEHFDAQLISLPTIKPLDIKTIVENLKGKKLAVTIDDAAKSGGISTIIARAIAENAIGTPMLSFAFPDLPIVHGTIDELDKFYGTDETSIIKGIEAWLNDCKTKA